MKARPGLPCPGAGPRAPKLRAPEHRAPEPIEHPSPSTTSQASMLSINNIEVVYDSVILVLRGVSLEVKPGAITTLLGANGAGKTTTLKAISGLLRTERGEVTKGTITLEAKR